MREFVILSIANAPARFSNQVDLPGGARLAIPRLSIERVLELPGSSDIRYVFVTADACYAVTNTMLELVGEIPVSTSDPIVDNIHALMAQHLTGTYQNGGRGADGPAADSMVATTQEMMDALTNGQSPLWVPGMDDESPLPPDRERRVDLE